MLNKYIEFIKRLTESVFEIKDVGSFADYFEAVWRGFLLLFVIIVSIAGILAVVIGPFFLWKLIWKKLSQRHINEINRLWKEGNKDAVDKMNNLANKLTKMKCWYIGILITAHTPFVLPLILMLLDFVF